MALPYLLLRVTSEAEAKAFIRSVKCTPCMRKSYAGVKWRTTTGVEETLRWEDL